MTPHSTQAPRPRPRRLLLANLVLQEDKIATNLVLREDKIVNQGGEMPYNALVEEKIREFEQQGVPSAFARDLSLGKPQPPARGNLVNVVVGTRRCGKTFRLYQEMADLMGSGVTFDRMLYFNFEDERLKPYDPSLLGDVLDTFFALHPSAQEDGSFLFLDEVQEVPEWGTFLRRVVDSTKATIYVTGSSSKMLSAELGSEFRGRSLSRELFPLSFSEFVRYHRGSVPNVSNGVSASDKALLRHELADYLVRGGFIATLSLPPADALMLLQEYASRTVAIDVVERYGLRNPRVAGLFLTRCLASSGRELSVSKVYGEFRSRQVSVSRETLGNLLSYYEDAYLLFSVGEFSRSLADNSRSSSKVYAADPALLTAYSPASASDEGQRLETAVFNALRRLTPAVRNGSVSRLLMAEGSRQHEVDFIVGDALLMQAYQLLQVSVGMKDERTRARELGALDVAMARFGIKESIVVTLDEEGEELLSSGTVSLVPAWKWLLQ